MNLPNVWQVFQGQRGLGKLCMNEFLISKATVKGIHRTGSHC